jgi:hypothetical protein
MILAAGKIRDHVSDRDGAYARRVIASGAGRAAGRWQAAGERAAADIGFDTTFLTSAITRQAELERSSGATAAAMGAAKAAVTVVTAATAAAAAVTATADRA